MSSACVTPLNSSTWRSSGTLRDVPAAVSGLPEGHEEQKIGGLLQPGFR